MSRIKYTKKGQPYIIDKKTGRARFIKKRSAKSRSRSRIPRSKPRKKSRGVRYMARKKRRSYRRSSKFEIVPAIVAGAVEPTINQLSAQIPVVGQLGDDVVKVGIGYFLGKRAGLLGKTARVLGYIGLARLGSGLISGGLNLLGGSSGNAGIEVS